MRGRARGGRRRPALGEVRREPEPSSGPPAAGPAAPGRPRRSIIFSITVTGIMGNTLIAPAIPDIIGDLGVTEGQAGVLVAAAALPGIVVAPVIGLLADRYGRREVLVPCLVLFGLFGGLASFAPSYLLLLACRLAQGVGSAGLINLAVVLIGDHWAGTERASVIGQNAAVLTTSLAVLPVLGGVLTDAGGWRWTFVPYWAGLVTAVAVAAALPRSQKADVAIGEQVRVALGFLRSRRVVSSMGSGVVIFMLIFGLVLTALPIHLTVAFGLDATGRGLVLGLPAITSTLAALSLGRLRSRFGARRLVLLAGGVYAVTFVAMGQAPVLGLVLVAVALYGVADGVTIPSLQEIVASAAPASSRGAVFAVWVGGVRLGQSSGPIAAGALVAGVGAPATFAVGAGLAVLLVAVQLASGQPSDPPADHPPGHR
jgi:MFS transporter, ACDE family, multidrug resistance protein